MLQKVADPCLNVIEALRNSLFTFLHVMS
jgi:hypothetical protein